LARRTAVSVAVFEDETRARVLAVRRPDDPGEDFAGMWGLPAATVREGETPEAAVARLGRDKLGLTLQIVRPLAEGAQARADGALHMLLFEALALDWPPRLAPATDPGSTHYTGWAWLTSDLLLPAADAGSLCVRLFLEAAKPKP
jgi:ADP-ribose pyrophosphatase YjhB (NUDIX family)